MHNMKYMVLLFASLFLLASCNGKSKNDNQQSENQVVEQQAATESATQLPIERFPWDFPSDLPITAEVGDWVLAPYTFYPICVKDGKDLMDESLIFYHTKIDSIGAAESKVGRKAVLPNSLIIPLPKGEEANVGDILLTWWQGGSGLERAIVKDASDKTKPIVDFLDMTYSDDPDNPDFANENSNIQLEPNSFLVLKDGEWMPGMPIAIHIDDSWRIATLIRATNDRVFAIGFSSIRCTSC